MTVDAQRARAYRFRPHVVEVERAQLVDFADATGQTDPVYLDVDAARVAGHPDLPVPPTFFYCLELGAPDALSHLSDLGVDLARLVHGEQALRFHAPAHAGDRLALHTRIADVYEKAGGRLQLLVRETSFMREEALVAQSTTTLVLTGADA